MKNTFFILFLTFVYCDLNAFLLKDLYDNRTTWKKYDVMNNKNIYTGQGINDDIVFIKIEQQVDVDREELFEVLKDIELYNQVVSNKNLFSDIVKVENDTIYGHQLITNAIPLVRNRQYVFKMYNYDDSRLDWTLLDSKNILMQNFLNKNAHNLYYGAGSWFLSEDDLLSYRMFIDDEVNLPNRFVQKIRVTSAVNIFDDILHFLNSK